MSPLTLVVAPDSLQLHPLGESHSPLDVDASLGRRAKVGILRFGVKHNSWEQGLGGCREVPAVATDNVLLPEEGGLSSRPPAGKA